VSGDYDLSHADELTTALVNRQRMISTKREY